MSSISSLFHLPHQTELLNGILQGTFLSTCSFFARRLNTTDWLTDWQLFMSLTRCKGIYKNTLFGRRSCERRRNCYKKEGTTTNNHLYQVTWKIRVWICIITWSLNTFCTSLHTYVTMTVSFKCANVKLFMLQAKMPNSLTTLCI